MFRDVTQVSIELIVTENTWEILIGALQTIAETFSFDKDEMMRAIIHNNNIELNAVRKAFEAIQ